MLPATKNAPQVRWHRPHPDHSDQTVCGRSCRDIPRSKSTPKKRLRCDLCEVRAEEAAVRENRAAQADHDRRDEAAVSSVRALRGGLPGLGRRR